MPGGGESWKILEDVLGPHQFWPKYIINAFWKKRWTYPVRLVIASFCYGNGCNIELALDFYREFRSGGRSFSHYRDVVKKCRKLFEWFDSSAIIRSRFNYFDLVMCKVCDLNGVIVSVENGNVVRYKHNLPEWACRDNLPDFL